MYEYTDRAVRFLNRQFVKLFNELKTVTKNDELNTLKKVKSVYSDSEEISVKMFLQISKNSYKYAEDIFLSKYTAQNKTKINKSWVNKRLNAFDPVTGYVFYHEKERKTARTFEKIMSTTLVVQAVRKALRYWADMVKQYADNFTDYATLQAYEDYGVKKVEWITEEDDRVCEICMERHGKVYDIKKVPPKPHWGCRCRLIPKE